MRGEDEGNGEGRQGKDEGEDEGSKRTRATARGRQDKNKGTMAQRAILHAVLSCSRPEGGRGVVGEGEDDGGDSNKVGPSASASSLCHVAGEKRVALWPTTYCETGQARQCTGSGNLEGGGGLTLCVLFLLLAPAGAGGDGAAEDLWSPPAGDGALRMVEAEDGVGVGEGPCGWALWEAGDEVEGGEGGGWGVLCGCIQDGAGGEEGGPVGGGDELHGLLWEMPRMRDTLLTWRESLGVLAVSGAETVM